MPLCEIEEVTVTVMISDKHGVILDDVDLGFSPTASRPNRDDVCGLKARLQAVVAQRAVTFVARPAPAMTSDHVGRLRQANWKGEKLYSALVFVKRRGQPAGSAKQSGFGVLLKDVKVIWEAQEADGTVDFILSGKSATALNF